uniref:Uncharacterized protein n=1 Tax=Anguilla anguilla TaxID=7936 RepID=A0A0E9RN66_ANGAN
MKQNSLLTLENLNAKLRLGCTTKKKREEKKG